LEYATEIIEKTAFKVIIVLVQEKDGTVKMCLISKESKKNMVPFSFLTKHKLVSKNNFC
jgi:hypothetical protein